VSAPSWVVLCNGATQTTSRPKGTHLLELESRIGIGTQRNVKINLPRFVRDVFWLPDRFLDLLQLAAYVFAADRLAPRGSRDAVEYQSWAREFHFIIRVRDLDFWQSEDTMEALSEVLIYMTGDRAWSFDFQPLTDGSVDTLFCSEEFKLVTSPTSIVLFSGGLDSLGGAVDRLERSTDHVCLVSHQSSPRQVKSQDSLANALAARYPDRTSHYRFPCTLKSPAISREETQRTRSFLFTAIAFSLAKALGQEKVFLYENGITSLNLMRREDLGNARASRTTHPKTLRNLEAFFSLAFESYVAIDNPSFWKTKADVFTFLDASPHGDLASSAVSCSRLSRSTRSASHCGTCFQCIDRRLAAYSSSCEEIDGPGNYAQDFLMHAAPTAEDQTTLVDYLRQAGEFMGLVPDSLMMSRLRELSDIVEFVPGYSDDLSAVDNITKLLQTHGQQIRTALKRIQALHEEPFAKLENGSLLSLVATREHLKAPVARLVGSLESILQRAIPTMFRKHQPADEPDLNAKMRALLAGHREDLHSEHPAASFACAGFIPDHTLSEVDVLIEAKYLRGNTSPSKARDGISADLTNCPANFHILFLVYDPYHAIPDDSEFKSDFESKGFCTICIVH